MAPHILSFDRAMAAISGVKHKHLLLGNGFSIALKPDIFTYGSLYENADFGKAPHVTKLFEALKTKDFEVVIKHLQDAATVVEVYRPTAVRLARSLRKDAAAIKDAFVTAIAKRHPDRPYDIKPEQYAACRAFLAKFGHLFTLNYDVLLYWALMQDAVDKLDIPHDDGFRHPEDDPTQRGFRGSKLTRRLSAICTGLFICSTPAQKSRNTPGRKPTSRSLSKSALRSAKKSIHSSLRRGRARANARAFCIAGFCTRLTGASRPVALRLGMPLSSMGIHLRKMMTTSFDASPRETVRICW